MVQGLRLSGMSELLLGIQEGRLRLRLKTRDNAEKYLDLKTSITMDERSVHHMTLTTTIRDDDVKSKINLTTLIGARGTKGTGNCRTGRATQAAGPLRIRHQFLQQ